MPPPPPCRKLTLAEASCRATPSSPWTSSGNDAVRTHWHPSSGGGAPFQGHVTRQDNRRRCGWIRVGAPPSPQVVTRDRRATVGETATGEGRVSEPLEELRPHAHRDPDEWR